jgi:tetratricopeptide (TPR) repeat protein
VSAAKDERVAGLLEKGLEHYGLGEVGKAILAWEEVLVLDPGNSDALDYIKTADRRRLPRGEKQEEAPSAVRSLAAEAGGLVAAARFEEALELLRSAAEADPMSLEVQAHLDLVRARLLRGYRERVGDLAAVPVLKAGADAITKFNLPKDAGFLLSMIDGATCAEDLISLSGMDSFEALRVLHGLLESGIVELRA